MGRSTRDRIVDAAIALFNEGGVSTVTTNHIAAHLGISPGNLYYHFANKEEIVREAFVRMNAEAEEVWRVEPAQGVRPAVDPAALQRMLVGNLRLYQRYLFFAREAPALLRADPELRRRYAEVSAARMRQLEEVLALLAREGLLRGLDDPEDVRAVVESAWMIGIACVPYAEAMASGPPPRSAKARAERVKAAIERGAVLVLHLFEPYMDPLAYAALVVLVRSELAAADARPARLDRVSEAAPERCALAAPRARALPPTP